MNHLGLLQNMSMTLKPFSTFILSVNPTLIFGFLYGFHSNHFGFLLFSICFISDNFTPQ